MICPDVVAPVGPVLDDSTGPPEPDTSLTVASYVTGPKAAIDCVFAGIVVIPGYFKSGPKRSAGVTGSDRPIGQFP